MSFTKGKIYFTNRDGNLVDNDGDERLRPQDYKIGSVYKFVECPISLENK